PIVQEENRGPMLYPKQLIGEQPVKLSCSCIRNKRALLDRELVLSAANSSPRDGDLIIVRCVDSQGAYDQVEDELGHPVRLYAGDVFLAILGTRRSGTNLMGEVPSTPLSRGDRLDLVAVGGLVAVGTAVPGYYGSRALRVEVVAFPSDAEGRVLNVAD